MIHGHAIVPQVGHTLATDQKKLLCFWGEKNELWGSVSGHFGHQQAVCVCPNFVIVSYS